MNKLFSLDLKQDNVRSLLKEYKYINGIIHCAPLDDVQRIKFELWAKREAVRRNIDIYGEERKVKL